MNVAAEPLPCPDGENQSSRSICFMEMFLYDNRPPADAVPQKGGANAIMLYLSSYGVAGCAVCPVPPSERRFDMIQWAAVFLKLKGLSLAECLDYVRRHGDLWGIERKGLAESALADLNDNLNRPFVRRPRSNKEREHSELIERSQCYCYYALK